MLRKTLIGLVALLAIAPAAASAAPELSITDRLQDRRYIASSERAYAIGFEDGRFYANGWHITGEMGGVWTPPLKLVDGVWFGVDDQWVGQATTFRSGWGYTEMDLPPTAGLQLSRTDFAPDGGRAALFGLHVRNPGAAARTVPDQGRRALGAHGRVSVGLRRRGAERERQPRRHRGVRRECARLPRAGQAAAPERGDPRLGGTRGREPEAGRGRDGRDATAATRATTCAARRSRRASATTGRSAAARAGSSATS